MPGEFTLRVCRTVELDDRTRNAIIQVCFDAHQEPDFLNLFAYLPPDELHIIALTGERLVSHAVVTTRWMESEGQSLLKSVCNCA